MRKKRTDSSSSSTHWKFWLPPKTPEAESKLLCKHGNSTVISSFTKDYISSGSQLDEKGKVGLTLGQVVVAVTDLSKRNVILKIAHQQEQRMRETFRRTTRCGHVQLAHTLFELDEEEDSHVDVEKFRHNLHIRSGGRKTDATGRGNGRRRWTYEEIR